MPRPPIEPVDLTFGAGSDSVLWMDAVPVFCNALATTAEAALAAPTGIIELAYSPATGYLWNRAFDPGLAAYNPAYENALHYSPRFVSFAESLADRLIERYRLRHRRVVEIGAGEGNFLSLLCEKGPNEGVGYDPSYDPARPKVTTSSRVRIERRNYPTDHPIDADLVVCQHVLEHLADPGELLIGVRRSLDPAGATSVYFEVPDATYMVEKLAIWDVIYEHCSYFAAPTLRWLFERCGFAATEVGRCFGDQYLYLEAAAQRTLGAAPSAGPPLADLVALTAAVARFSDHVERLIATWQRRLAGYVDAGPVAIWGAGSKGVTFLNLVPGGNEVVSVVDVNPNKTGLYVPGTGQRVCSPEELTNRAVATVLVMNPLYITEIESMLRQRGLTADVIAVSG